MGKKTKSFFDEKKKPPEEKYFDSSRIDLITRTLNPNTILIKNSTNYFKANCPKIKKNPQNAHGLISETRI